MGRNLPRDPFTDIENRHGLSTHPTGGSVISPHSVGRRSSADTHTGRPHDHIELQQSRRATLHLVVRTRAPGLVGGFWAMVLITTRAWACPVPLAPPILLSLVLLPASRVPA